MRIAAAAPSPWRGVPIQKVEGAGCRSLRGPAEPRASSRADLPAPRCPLRSGESAVCGAAAGSQPSRQPGRGCATSASAPKGRLAPQDSHRATSGHLRTDLPTQRPEMLRCGAGARAARGAPLKRQRREPKPQRVLVARRLYPLRAATRPATRQSPFST